MVFESERALLNEFRDSIDGTMSGNGRRIFE